MIVKFLITGIGDPSLVSARRAWRASPSTIDVLRSNRF